MLVEIDILCDPSLKRNFTVVDGIPFYQSTGSNSGVANTWFPCLGILNSKNPYHLRPKQLAHKKGWIIKGSVVPSVFGIPSDIEPLTRLKINSAYPMFKNFKGEIKNAKSFFRRMSYSRALIISAKLGGGIWNTLYGVRLHKELQKTFKKSYESLSITIKSIAPTTLTINQWLMIKGAGDVAALTRLSTTAQNPLIKHFVDDTPYDKVSEIDKKLIKNSASNALLMAMFMKNIHWVEILIKNGAELNAKNRYDITAENLIVGTNDLVFQKQCMKLLVAHEILPRNRKLRALFIETNKSFALYLLQNLPINSLPLITGKLLKHQPSVLEALAKRLAGNLDSANIKYFITKKLPLIIAKSCDEKITVQALLQFSKLLKISLLPKACFYNEEIAEAAIFHTWSELSSDVKMDLASTFPALEAHIVYRELSDGDKEITLEKIQKALREFKTNPDSKAEYLDLLKKNIKSNSKKLKSLIYYSKVLAECYIGNKKKISRVQKLRLAILYPELTDSLDITISHLRSADEGLLNGIIKFNKKLSGRLVESAIDKLSISQLCTILEKNPEFASIAIGNIEYIESDWSEDEFKKLALLDEKIACNLFKYHSDHLRHEALLEIVKRHPTKNIAVLARDLNMDYNLFDLTPEGILYLIGEPRNQAKAQKKYSNLKSLIHKDTLSYLKPDCFKDELLFAVDAITANNIFKRYQGEWSDKHLHSFLKYHPGLFHKVYPEFMLLGRCTPERLLGLCEARTGITALVYKKNAKLLLNMPLNIRIRLLKTAPTLWDNFEPSFSHDIEKFDDLLSRQLGVSCLQGAQFVLKNFSDEISLKTQTALLLKHGAALPELKAAVIPETPLPKFS